MKNAQSTVPDIVKNISPVTEEFDVVGTNDNLVRKDVNDGQVTSSESSHPIGTVLGTVAGMAAGISGAVVSGAAVGAVAGPLGAAIGAVIGGGIGAGVGHEIAAQINPHAEDLFWRENYITRPYVITGSDFETYSPAYRYGMDTYAKFPDSDFDDIEPSLSHEWYNTRGTSKLDWNIARHATRDAFEKLKNSK
jgi:hypothetical protein